MSQSVYDLYPNIDRDDDYWWRVSDYQPIINSFGCVAIQVDDDGYQGDSRVLYKDGKRYGWLQFGWGSCSGCDALQGCESPDEVQQLVDALRASIKWFDSAAEALEFFNTHDWEGDYSWFDDGQQEFVDKVRAYLAEEGKDA